MIDGFEDRVIRLFGLLFVLSTVATVVNAQPSTPLFDLQGHRGARGLHPENTLEGFREALTIGVTTLEMDAALTRDGVVVLHHDERLNPDIARGADGTWIGSPTPALHTLTWQQLQFHDVGRLRPGSEYAARFPEQRGRDGVRVPRLADVLSMAERACSGGMRYNVETKRTPNGPDSAPTPNDIADAVVSVLEAGGVAARAIVQSFDWQTLRRVEDIAPGLATACLTSEAPDGDTIQRGKPGASPWTAGLDVDDFGGSVPRLVQAIGCRIWSPRHQDLSAVDVALSHELGIRVVPWTVNDRAEIESMLDLGVDGIISDYPDRVRAALQGRDMLLPTPCSSAPSPP